jgi:conjugative relaxase-like TrwC/TraI family protein
MLSLCNVGKGGAASTYYEKADDYYSQDQSPSTWWGEASVALGLTGSVDPKLFASMLDGRLPNGAALHNAAAGRRGGTDATFSAPKSVSLQCLVGGDTRIVDAHRRAVERALTFAETLVSCRVTEGGLTRSEKTGNLVVARFQHDLSRACDPQLHTHCVMINATRRADGQWRATDNQAIYRNKMLIGSIYRAQLARELQLLGYQVRLTHADGRFELAHMDDRQVKAFSQRSAAIEEYLKSQSGLERGQASAWEKKLVAIITRDKKVPVHRAELAKQWAELSASENINYQVQKPSHERTTELDTSAVSNALSDAIDHVGERHAVFSKTVLLQAAVERGVGIATFDDIEKAVEMAVQSGVLICDGERYTTEKAQKMEREILAMEVEGRQSLPPVHTGNREELMEKLSILSPGQKSAALGVLLSANRVIGIQGRAGVGKTTLLKVTAEAAVACGYRVTGLAPSSSAARELSGAGIASETISAFIQRSTKGLNARTLLVVDEAGMASSTQMHAIFTAAREAGCRIVLVGDTGQLNSVEAGKPFAQLQYHGMHTTMVNQIQRQKSPLLKAAVELAVEGQVAMSVQILEKHITEIFSSAERFERIASDYVGLSAAERASTRVIAGTRYARGEINRSIRNKLGLEASGHEFVLLDRKDHTAQQARSILSYETGDVVLAEADYASLGLKRGDAAKVSARLSDCVLLECSDGTEKRWQPALATKLSAYVPVKRPLSIGDLVRVTANDRTRGMINGDLARVTSISQEVQTLTLQFDDGRNVTLDGRIPLALDYGYCSTVHSAQGQTCDQVLIEADSHSLTANQKTFYVAISRARHNAQIYTDDRETLPFAMSREIENLSALDVYQRQQGFSKNPASHSMGLE